MNSEDIENQAACMDTSADVTVGMKRGGDPQSAGKNKKRKTGGAGGPPQTKNALMQLNELKPGLIYNVIAQGGPVHNPTFTIAVDVNGQIFKGIASSKKKAKLNAAENALASFVQVPNSAARAQASATVKTEEDFTGDDTMGNLETTDDPMATGDVATKKAVPQQPPGKNPVMILNEVRPGTQYVALTDVQSYQITKVFVMEVTVDGKTFQGEGRNKKIAKARAAQAALKDMFNLEFKLPEGSEPVQAGDSASNKNGGKKDVPPIADGVAKLVQSKFNQLTSGLNAQYARKKVLAGIVMTMNGDLDNAVTICVTTGTKCVNGEYMSVSGLSINDCHAEILARRCLRRFLFEQLRMLVEGDDSNGSCEIKKEDPEKELDASIVQEQAILKTSIFEANPDASTGGYNLKDGVEFHLYISTSPCGDSRIFSPHENTKDEDDRHPNRKARGQLRTKIESGEGTIPISEAKIQTWDGILQGGERLLTMSCSDKLAKWNVLGLQGALLGYFIPPIYFSSIILGSFYHRQHLSRAILNRYGVLENLPPKFQVAQPLLSGVLNEASRTPAKATGFAVDWIVGNSDIEVLTTTRGKTESEKPSQLCKYEMFKLFSTLYSKLNKRQQTGINTENISPANSLYCDVKKAQNDYQQAKQIFEGKLKQNALGIWVHKPFEHDEFTLGDSVHALQSMVSNISDNLKKMKQESKMATGDNEGVGDTSLTGVTEMLG